MEHYVQKKKKSPLLYQYLTYMYNLTDKIYLFGNMKFLVSQVVHLPFIILCRRCDSHTHFSLCQMWKARQSVLKKSNWMDLISKSRVLMIGKENLQLLRLIYPTQSEYLQARNLSVGSWTVSLWGTNSGNSWWIWLVKWYDFPWSKSFAN